MRFVVLLPEVYNAKGYLKMVSIVFFLGDDSKLFSLIAENRNHINFYRNVQGFDRYWPYGNIKINTEVVYPDQR